jgi:hypothetical protein
MHQLEDIDLPEIKTEEEIEDLRQLMAERDVWRNLGRMEQPKKGKFLLLFQVGKYAAHFIRYKKSDRIGFLLLDQGRIKSSGRVEVDIAISDSNHRKKGASMIAMTHLFDEWLLSGRCDEFWGWIDIGNTASMKMVESLGIPIVKRGQADGNMVDGKVDTVELVMNAQIWRPIRSSLKLS